MQGYTYFSYFLLQNIDCGYSLEPPRRGGSNVYPQSMFWSKNKKNIKNFPTKFSFFSPEKKSLYIAWASFRNGTNFSCIVDTGRLSKIQILIFHRQAIYSSVVLSTFILDRSIRAIFFNAQTHAYSKAGGGGDRRLIYDCHFLKSVICEKAKNLFGRVLFWLHTENQAILFKKHWLKLKYCRLEILRDHENLLSVICELNI